jgi:hypothetical protein
MNQTSSDHTSSSGASASPVMIGCLVLIVSFFLPWVSILGKTAAGYELQQIWEPGPFLWAIPSLAAIAMAIGFTGKRNVEVAQVAGGIPFVFLGVALFEFGGDVMNALSIGAYGTLISGVFLLCVAPRLVKNEAAALKHKEESRIEHEAGTGR